MSWFDDIARLFGRGGTEIVATSSNQTSVTVNPQILTVIDTTPLAASQQALVNSLAGVTPALAGAAGSLAGVAPAIESVGSAIREAAAVQQDGTEQLREITILVSVAGIAFALLRMVAGK